MMKDLEKFKEILSMDRFSNQFLLRVDLLNDVEKLIFSVIV